MADTFQIKLVTPTGVIYQGKVEQVIAHDSNGEFVVLPNHADLKTTLVPGVITLKPCDGSSTEYQLTGGFAEVKDGVMTVRASEAAPIVALDAGAAEMELQVAEQRFGRMSFYNPGYQEAKEALQVARARAEIGRRRRTLH
jgi:F-type H+-transporting ATPase subunit epsilon